MAPGSLLRRSTPMPSDPCELFEGPSEVRMPRPGSATAYRKVVPLGKAVLRKRAKLVKEERIGREKSQDVAEELVWVMRGPKLPGVGRGS